MIQILYTYGDKDILKEVLEDLQLQQITPITEMLEGAFLTIIKPEQVTILEDALKQPPLKMEFIGSYEMDGSQYIWIEPTEIQRNHSINKYKNKLKNIVILDENGDVISDTPPTEAEALNTQVNLIAGFPNRILQ